MDPISIAALAISTVLQLAAVILALVTILQARTMIAQANTSIQQAEAERHLQVQPDWDHKPNDFRLTTPDRTGDGRFRLNIAFTNTGFGPARQAHYVAVSEGPDDLQTGPLGRGLDTRTVLMNEQLWVHLRWLAEEDPFSCLVTLKCLTRFQREFTRTYRVRAGTRPGTGHYAEVGLVETL